MDFKQFVLVVFWSILLNELCFISTTTTTTFVAAMSIANQDLERYFRTKNVSQTLTVMTEERIALDMYTYAYLNYSYLNDQHQLIDMTFSEEKARYGEGKVFNIRGRLVHITDVTDSEALSSSSASASGAAVVGILDGGDYACTPNILGTRGSPTPPTGVKWIALVRRGRCTFEEKVMHVHAKGASGVIIYNDKPVSNLEKMQIKGKSRNITAVITYQDIGQDMARIVDQGVDVMAAIIEGRSGMRPLNTMNRTSVLFVSISFIVLMIISLVWLVFYYIQRFRYLQSKDQQSRHLCSVTKKAIMKIPTKTGKTSDEKDLDSDCCAICIEAYKTSDCIRVLPCKHEFHKNCIDPWLIEHRTCPMCKLDVLKFYGYVFLGSEESILEYEADHPQTNGIASTIGLNVPAAVVVAANAVTNADAVNGTTDDISLHPDPSITSRSTRPLSELLGNHDFLIDFPRIFVLDAGGSCAIRSVAKDDSVMRDRMFQERMPERSQSSISLAQAKDWMTMVSNKLEEQHGLRRLRQRDEMNENLLSVPNHESVKKRRSRSADGRYSNVYFTRRNGSVCVDKCEHNLGQIDGNPTNASNVVDAVALSSSRRSRRREHSSRSSSGVTLRLLTDASYAQSIQRQREELYQRTKRRSSGMLQGSIIQSSSRLNYAATPSTTPVATRDNDGGGAIQIQINGEGIDF